MRLLIATHNKGKYAEIGEVLGELSIKLVSLNELGLHDEVEEHGASHEENAILKARYFLKKSRLPTLAEDSGIYVDAFPGELGVQTRRWKGLHHASDKEWIEHFLEEMKGVPDGKRGATFVCIAALILPGAGTQDIQIKIFSGETAGFITRHLEAPLKEGIPISSCFRPAGFDKVYAALTVQEKNCVSHRGKAMHRVKNFLKNFC